MSRHLMILPSLACQASCTYCFGPNRGPTMPAEVFDAALDWIDVTTGAEQTISLTFHGGEPLIAGRGWYQRNLPLLRKRFGERIKIHMQSNLWLLDETYCTLFKEYGVSLGTSLDGPEQINDLQCGGGYFAKTMAGIETARRNDLGVGVICTFTGLSAPFYRQVCDFFADEQLDFSIHIAIRALHQANDNALFLSANEYAKLYVRLFDYYLENIGRMRISTFDVMAQGISSGQGGLCTFGHCLGDFFTLESNGGIYPCNRFACHPEWQLGKVSHLPSLDALASSPVWQQLRQRELTVHQDCGDCPHFDYCMGGCVYNAIAGSSDRRDPYCTAYKRIFDHLTERALDEVFSKENVDAVVANGLGKHGLMRKGKLLQIMRRGPHPRTVASRARELVAAVALAVSDSPEVALRKLDRAGLIARPEVARQSLASLRHRLDTQSQQRLGNAYIHVTYSCNLTCTHCYARCDPNEASAMSIDDIVRLVHEVSAASFRKAVITGGEPLAHPQRDALLDALADLREDVEPLQTVLRTNLACQLPPTLVERLAHSTDQVVVSVDGNEASHDARRGPGAFVHTVENLRILLAANPSARVAITAVLTGEQASGPEGDTVRALGQELGVRVRFKPILPIGRATEMSLAPEFYSSLDDGAEAVAYRGRVAATCGLGMNLYVEPEGRCYPCYALMSQSHDLGHVLKDGLAAVLERNDTYRHFTVDSNQLCRHCALRYLCGGFCRAWHASDDPNAPPTDCTTLYERAQDLLLGALDALDVPAQRWLTAGLSLPEAPPEIDQVRGHRER